MPSCRVGGGGSALRTKAPGKVQLARCGDRMQPHAARMHPRKRPIFLVEGPSFGAVRVLLLPEDASPANLLYKEGVLMK